MEPPKNELSKVAFQIVNTSLSVRKGDMIRINTWRHSLDFAQELAIQCFRKGAIPLITITTDRVFKEGLSCAPLETLSFTPTHELGILQAVNAQIMISGPEDTKTLLSVNHERIQKYRLGGVKLSRLERERKIPTLQVHLGKVTKKRAERYGISFEKWWDVVMSALAVDYVKIQERGEKLSRTFAKGGKVTVTSPNGTRFEFQVKTDQLQLDDGIISVEDREHGNIYENLPAGVFIVSPIEGTARGVIHIDTPQLRVGGVVRNTSLRFSKGLLTSIRSEENVETLEETFDRICAEKPVFNSMGIGLNPKMQPGFLFEEIVLGRISVATGGKSEACVITGVLSTASVFLNGIQIVNNGKLVI